MRQYKNTEKKSKEGLAQSIVKRIFIFFFIFVFFISSAAGVLEAQTPPPGSPGTPGGPTAPPATPVTGPDGRPIYRGIDVSTESQYRAYIEGQAQRDQATGRGFAAGAAELGGCSVGQLLAGILRNGISSVLGNVKAGVTGLAGQADPTTALEVKVADNLARQRLSQTVRKDVDSSAAGGVFDTSALIETPSFDAIGFCLANAAIHYVAQSTINWINSGFQGSPSFIDDPGQFFLDAADSQAGAFLQELGLGFLCTDFAPRVRIALVNDYLKTPYQQRAQCTLTQAASNIEKVSQDLSQGNLNSYIDFTTNPANRPYSSYLMAQDELRNRVASQQATLNFEFRYSDFLSVKDCPEVIDKKTGQKVKGPCKNKTVGSMIENAANETLNLPKGRLAIADEFDEVIVALVNQLIKTALSEVLTPDPNETLNNGGNSSSTDEEDEEEEDEDGGGGGTPPGNPPQPRPLIVSCTTDKSEVVVGEPVAFTVQASGGSRNKDYIYEWNGIEGVEGPSSEGTLIIEFTEPTDASAITVTVTSGNREREASCPAVKVLAPPPLTGSCAPDKDRARMGETVVWSVTPEGGTGEYAYLWSGSSELNGETTKEVEVTYNEEGREEGSVVITSGRQSIGVECEDSVRVRN